MTGKASRKPRWLGGFCAVLIIYSPDLIAKSVLVETVKAMPVNEDHSNHHPPRGSLATPSYVGIRVTGARVLCQEWCICKPRSCRTVHDVHHIAEQKSRSGMHRRLHGLRTANTHDDNNTTHAPHAYQLQPTTDDVVYLQGTFSDLHALKHNDEDLVAVSWGRKCHVDSTISSRFSARAQVRRHVNRTYRIVGTINVDKLPFRRQFK